MHKKNIAVIGSGISGLSAAWLLSKRHRITLYEASDRLGGHANTVDVETANGTVPVDTGFIVYNEPNYPNLTALFDHIGVETAPTNMSFALSDLLAGYEYSGSGFSGFFGQKRNLLRANHWRLLADINHFFRTAQKHIKLYPFQISLGEFLTAEGYCETFITDHIVPMGAAIWSTSMPELLRFPAHSFIRFYANHGMLQFGNRVGWRTVTGGSRNYISKLTADCDIEILTNTGVLRVIRHADYAHIVDVRGVERPFDHVVIATHADQALEMLNEPHSLETSLLEKFTYQKNEAVLHRDSRWMPHRKGIWSSWNFLRDNSARGTGLCVTYWMNRLQKLGTDTNLFVTLNPFNDIHQKAVDATFSYDHPVFDAQAMNAQRRLWDIQGVRRTWFCGSYFGYGFHEDGAQSGLAVAEILGGVERPWTVPKTSSRIAYHRHAKSVDAA